MSILNWLARTEQLDHPAWRSVGCLAAGAAAGILLAGCNFDVATTMPLTVAPPSATTETTPSPAHGCPASLITQSQPLAHAWARQHITGAARLNQCRYTAGTTAPGTASAWVSPDKPEWIEALSTDVPLPEYFTEEPDQVLLVQVEGRWYRARSVTVK